MQFHFVSNAIRNPFDFRNLTYDWLEPSGVNHPSQQTRGQRGQGDELDSGGVRSSEAVQQTRAWGGEVLTMVTGTLLHFHLLIVTQPRRRKSTSRERMSMQIKSQPPG